MEGEASKVLSWLYEYRDQVATITAALAAAIAAPSVGLCVYFRQKQYELVRTRYLDNGMDVIAAHVEYALGIFRHNWARSLNVLKHFRDMGSDMPKDLYRSGFLDLDPTSFRTVHGFLLRELTGENIFHTILQLLFSFVHNANTLFIYDLCSTVRASVEGGTEHQINSSRKEIFQSYLHKLDELNTNCEKFYVFQMSLNNISGALARQRFLFRNVEKLRKHPAVKSAVEMLKKEFHDDLQEYTEISKS